MEAGCCFFLSAYKTTVDVATVISNLDKANFAVALLGIGSFYALVQRGPNVLGAEEPVGHRRPS